MLVGTSALISMGTKLILKEEEIHMIKIDEVNSETSKEESKINSLNALREWQKYKQAVEFRKQLRDR